VNDGPWFSGPWRSGRPGLAAAGQAETVHFANHGVSGHAAHFGCDLACAEAFTPQLFEKFYTFVGPGTTRISHFLPPR
jgi:hypothetical protein